MPHKHTSPLKGPWCYPERREERRSEEGGERKGEKLRASPPQPHPSKPPTSPSPPHGTLWDSQVTEGRKLKTSRDGCRDRPLPTLSITVTEPWPWSPGASRQDKGQQRCQHAPLSLPVTTSQRLLLCSPMAGTLKP